MQLIRQRGLVSADSFSTLEGMKGVSSFSMRRHLTLLLTLTVLGLGSAMYAQGTGDNSADTKNDRQELRKDNRDLRKDNRDINADRQDAEQGPR